MQHFIGIDISKRDFYACFDEVTEPVRFSNNEVGIDKFIDEIKKRKMKKTNTMIGLESTSRYHLPLCIIGTHYGYQVKIINPIITSQQNKLNIRCVKNDRADSRTIRFCTVRGKGYVFQDTTEDLVIKNLVRQRYLMVHFQSDLKRKQQDIEYKEKYIKTPITDVNNDLERYISKKVKELEQQIELHNSDQQVLLQSIPGIGKVTSAVLVAEIGNISKFKYPKQLVGFIGIDPRVKESGTSIKGKGYITKRGNRIIRKTLYNAAMAAMQRPNMFYDFYHKKVSEGKPKKVALVAVMRKMVHVIFAVWKRGEPFVA